MEAVIGATAMEGKAAKSNRLTYRWVKELETWVPSTVAANSWNKNVEAKACEADGGAEHELFSLVSEDCDVPISDQAVVDKRAEEWATLWQESTQYVKPDFDNTQAPIGPLLEDSVRLAANLGGGNIAPRAIARLSRPAIQALIARFLFFEASGEWCYAVSLVLIVLLPMPDGGRMPKGLFLPSLAPG